MERWKASGGGGLGEGGKGGVRNEAGMRKEGRCEGVWFVVSGWKLESFSCPAYVLFSVFTNRAKIKDHTFSEKRNLPFLLKSLTRHRLLADADSR